MNETPQISSSCYASNTTSLPLAVWGGSTVQERISPQASPADFVSLMALSLGGGQDSSTPITKIERSKVMADKPTRRIVQVFIADPNENVPLERSVLYTGEQKLTDLNDTELYFELPMAELLKKHNDYRVKLVDKEASRKSGREIYLEPVRIRDLRMVVVTVAQF